MHRSIMKLKQDLSEQRVKEINDIVDTCYDNDWGVSKNISTDPMVIIHENTAVFAICAGNSAFAKLGFLDDLESWEHIDTNDSRENTDALRTYKQFKEDNWDYIPPSKRKLTNAIQH